MAVEFPISNFIETQFPDFYKTEGENFVAFTKAYYEWQENSYQVLYLESTDGFDIGDTITQELNGGIAAGTIIAKEDTHIIVHTTSAEVFRCIELCGVLVIVESSSGGITFINRSYKPSALYHARHLRQYRDIDDTVDEFLLYFKEKYLKNIQFELATNKRLLVKHSLDLHRSKGTERAVDLLFKLIYGIESQVYYPGDDIFKLSDNEWVKPRYVEITRSDRTLNFIGKQITGTSTGSTAFVEKYVKRKTKKGFVYLLYLSNIVGDFELNEALIVDQIYPDSPRIVGSLSSITIVIQGSNFEVGDIVDIISISGDRGKARVTEVDLRVGEVSFELLDGGYGFSNTAIPYLAESVLEINNFDVNDYKIKLFDTLTEPLSNVHFINSTGTFTAGANVFSANSGVGKIVEVVQAGANGNLLISRSSGSFSGNVNIYTTGNTVVANTNAANTEDVTATVLSVSDFVTIETVTAPAGVTLLSIAYQIINGIKTFRGTVTNVFGSVILLDNTKGIIDKDLPLYFENSAVVVLINSAKVGIGVINASSTFIQTNEPYINIANTVTGTISTVRSGEGASYGVDVDDSEFVRLNTNLVGDDNANNVPYLNLAFNASTYQFPANVSGNSASIISTVLSYANLMLGTIESLVNINPGEGYTIDPPAFAFQPYVVGSEKRDYILHISNSTANFIPGEIIFQDHTANVIQLTTTSNTGFFYGERVYQGPNTTATTAQGTLITIAGNNMTVKNVTGTFTAAPLKNFANGTVSSNVLTAVANTQFYQAKGTVKSGNSSVLLVKRTSYQDLFTTNTLVTGESSNTQAYITHVSTDFESERIGMNAVIDTDVSSSNGAILNVAITDSGLGYKENANVIIQSLDSNDTATGISHLGAVGAGTGYFKTSKGFLSDTKKIFDGDYYQEYSYEVFSRLSFDKYSDMLKKTIHVAGTKVFGSVILSSMVDVTAESTSLITEEED